MTIPLLSWTPDLCVGIEAIDEQHKRIVVYINELHQARLSKDMEAVGRVIDGLMEYTQSHFRFEEELMNEAGYSLLPVHKKVHQLFERRINEYRRLIAQGEDVAAELQGTLVKWLINHIKVEDKDYSEKLLARIDQDKEQNPANGSGERGNALRGLIGGE